MFESALFVLQGTVFSETSEKDISHGLLVYFSVVSDIGFPFYTGYTG